MLHSLLFGIVFAAGMAVGRAYAKKRRLSGFDRDRRSGRRK